MLEALGAARCIRLLLRQAKTKSRVNTGGARLEFGIAREVVRSLRDCASDHRHDVVAKA
jgi:hypothetical protein